MKLIIEPTDGVAPLLAAIKSAKKSVEIAIFRFDRKDMETALKAAADRGVKVTVLIAFANRGGEQSLRKLELRCLAAGIIVARTADDLIRYHGKFILIDRRVLYMLSFNFTHLDIDHSRGFGIVTTNANWVREATKLFRADCTRTKYMPRTETFVVSPANSRKCTRHISQAGEETVADLRPENLGQGDAPHPAGPGESGRRDQGHRLGRLGSAPVRGPKTGRDTAAHAHDHPRPRQAFVGSQSLRTAELDSRREVGLIVQDAKAVKQLIDTFESDWASPAKERAGPTKELDAVRGQAGGNLEKRKQRRRFRSSPRNWIHSQPA